MTTGFGAQALALDAWGAGMAMRGCVQLSGVGETRQSTGHKIITMFCLSALVPLGETTSAQPLWMRSGRVG